MAFTTPRTWATGEIVTAAQLNTHLRDNLNAIRDEDVIFESTVPSFFGNGKTITQVLDSPPDIGYGTEAKGKFSEVEVTGIMNVDNTAYLHGDLYLTFQLFAQSVNIEEYLRLTSTGSYPLTPGSTELALWQENRQLYAKDSTGKVMPIGPYLPAICRVLKTANQSLTTSITTTITWDSEAHDPYAMHDNVTNNSRITVPYSGYYMITPELSYAANGTGLRLVIVCVNGVEVGRPAVANATATTPTVASLAIARYLNANDYVEIQGWQNSGGALNLLYTGPASTFGLYYLGAG